MTMSEIVIEELLFDRQESFNDIVMLLLAEKRCGMTDEDRLEGNLEIIETIRKECIRRGFDPAQYDQVQQIKGEKE